MCDGGRVTCSDVRVGTSDVQHCARREVRRSVLCDGGIVMFSVVRGGTGDIQCGAMGLV